MEIMKDKVTTLKTIKINLDVPGQEGGKHLNKR